MHELSIAVSLVEIAAERAGELSVDGAGGPRIEAVHIRLGALSGVVEEALRFSFDLAAGGTRLDGATLVVERVPVTIFCRTCRGERVLEEPLRFRCPGCGGPAGDVVHGREIELTALEVADHALADR